MADGLTFLLELDAKFDAMLGMNKAMKQSLDNLGKLDGGLRKIEQASGIASAGHHKQANEVDKLRHSMDRLGDSSGGVFAKIKAVAGFEIIRRGVSGAIDFAGRAVDKIGDIGVEMVKSAAGAERFEKSMEFLLGKKGAAAEMKRIDQFAKFSEFSPDQVKDVTHGLVRMGFKDEALGRVRAAAMDIAALSKNGFEGFQEGAGALAMMQRTGKVNDRILKPFGLGENDFMKQLSERTGMSIGTINDKIQKGTFDTKQSFETLFSIITKTTKLPLGSAGVEMSKTLDARLTKLASIPGEIGEKFKDTAAYEKLSDAVGRIYDKLDPSGPSGARIFGGIETAVDKIASMFEGIDLDKTLASALAVLDKMPVAITAVTETVNDLAEAFGPVVSAFEAAGKFAGIFGGDTTKHGSNVEAMKYDPAGQLLGQHLKDKLILSRAHAAAGIPFNDPDKVFGPQQTGIERLERMYKQMGELSGKGMAGGIDKANDLVAAASGGMGSKAEDALRGKLENHSPSKVFERIGMSTGQGFEIGIRKSMAEADNVMRGAFAIPTPGGAGGSFGGPIQVSLSVGDINVNAPGADGHQIAEQVSERIKEITPGMLASAFEKIASMRGGRLPSE